MKLFLFNNDEKLIGTVSPLEGIQNEEINKIQTIECTVVYSELIEKASYIGHKDYSDNRIFHLYKIDHVTKTSTTDVKIVGVHTFFDDMESDGYVKDFRPTNRELVGVLTTILDSSRWQLGSINVQRNYTGNFYYVTRKEAISKLIEATQIEIKPRLEFSRGKITGRYLDVFTRLGARNGKVFVHGRDLLTVSEKKSQGAIYTAVVGRGKGEETDTGGYGRRISFKDVEWLRTSGQPVDKPVGQEYVEIPAMTRLYGFEKGTKPRIKIVEFQDETDKEKLLRLSYEWLEKNSRMQVEYSAKVLNVGNLELGDTVGIFNPKLGIKYETRVFKVKRNLVNNKLTEFGIGDKVTTSPFSRTIELAKEMKNFQDDTVYWLDKIRERLSDKLINEDGYNYDLKADNEYKVPAGYYSFDKPIDQNPTKVVYMGAGKIAIANSKKPTGEWNWRTFLDGRGATLDLINTGVLKAGRIQSADGRSYWDLDTGEFHMEQTAINEAVKTVVNGKVQEIVGEVKKNLPTKEELKGKSSYLHKKYSDFADGRNMSDNSTLKYIGIYTGDKQQAPTNASEYSWTKIHGEDGRDGVNGKSINENLLPNSNFAKELENWEMARLNNSGLNWQKGHAIDNFGRGLHIWGTPNGEYKGLGTLFNLVAKQGEKLTLSMDLGKDALTQNAILYIGLHYVVNNDIVSQQWQTLDLATQNFEVRKYKRISKTFTVSADMNRCRLMIHTQNNKLINFYIDNIKLERGEIATEWSPAYEDLRGRDGVSNYIHRKYSDSSNGANMDDNSNRKYIGIYTGSSPTPPTTASSYLWSKIKGEDGANGVPGVRGADGRTPYFHTAYANSPTGDRDFSTTNSTNKLYIGTYSDFEVADSNDYRKYKWVKIKGEDGRNGNNGRDGISSYIFRKYSDNANGTPMSDNSNLKYIGIYTGTSATAPTTPTSYTWSKIKGEDGQQGVPGARGSDGRTSYLHTAYSNSATGDRDFSTTNSTNKEYIGTYTDFEINDSNDYRRYKWIKIKGENGANGRNGTDGHTLTANLRLEGTYINGVTNNVKAYLDVFYDGQKISDGFNAQIKFKGGILNNWSAFWTAKVDNTGFLTNVSWGNKEQQYPIALEVIVLVTYKDLNTIANARMENIPDIVEIKEITKKYRTFESTIDRFDSTIGEVKQQVLVNEDKRNLILGSRMISESDYKKMGNSVDLTLQQEYQGLPYLSVFQYGKTSKVWQGVGFDLSLTRITKGETYSIRIPIFISESSKPDEGAYLEIKNHDTGETLWNVRLDTSIYPIGNWNTHEYRFTASKDMNISKSSFCIYHVKNGYLAFAKPYMCEGDKLPKNYSPAPEDFYLQNSRIESSIKQTKDEIGLKVSKDEVISAINLSVEKNEQGQNQGVVKIKGEVLADNIHGKTFTGSKFKIGQYGFLQPIEKGLQINAPENFGSKRGIGLQIAGEGVGPKENGVPPGLFIYEDPDFTKGATIPSAVNRVLLTVAGMACFSTRVLGSVIKGQPILTNIDYSYPFSNVAPVKFIGYREGGFMHFYGTDNTNSDKWLIKVDQWGSDRKLKTDIKESEFNAIEFVDKLKFKEHGWNKDEVGYERPHTKCGLIAQELQELDESLVVDYGKYLGLDALRLINISLKAIQELSTENQQLKSQLKEMNERLQKLEDKINGNI